MSLIGTLGGHIQIHNTNKNKSNKIKHLTKDIVDFKFKQIENKLKTMEKNKK